jgi:predicted Zn finger-like uncharacterized protein
MIVSCDQCGVKLKVDESKIRPEGSKLKCPKCANIFTVRRPEEPAVSPTPPIPEPRPAVPPRPAPQAPPAPQPPPAVERAAPPEPKKPKWQLDHRKVVVAHDGDALLKMISDLLTGAGYEVITASDGIQAMVSITQERPFLAILDVALPRIYGFEICDRIKESEESKDIKVILIASIYDKTRYKREPTSLYGADDYIEKHHIPDLLVKKVQRLATEEVQSGEKPVREEQSYTAPPPEVRPVREQQAVEMRKEEIKDFPTPSPVDPQQVEAARRFARIILSDIALYNQGAVEEGIKTDKFREVLANELKEGRDLYNTRVSEDVRRSMDYFDDETEKFIEKKRRIMEMGG